MLTSSQCALIGEITFIVERIIVGEFYLHKFQFSPHSQCFSFDAENQHNSPANAIKSPAMNFPIMGLMFKNKSRCLFYFNSVNLSFADTYSRSEQGIIIWQLKTNFSVWTWLQFDFNFVYEKALLWLRNESMAIFFFRPQILIPFMRFQLLPVFI